MCACSAALSVPAPGIVEEVEAGWMNLLPERLGVPPIPIAVFLVNRLAVKAVMKMNHVDAVAVDVRPPWFEGNRPVIQRERFIEQALIFSNVSEIEVRERERWPEPKCFHIGGRRLVEFSLFVEADPHVVICVGKIRLELDGPLVGGNHLVVILLHPERAGHVVMGRGIVGLKPEGFPESGDRLCVYPAQLLERIAHVAIGSPAKPGFSSIARE